jgi:hypothetical protein
VTKAPLQRNVPTEVELQKDYSPYDMELWEDTDYAAVSSSDIGDIRNQHDDFGLADQIVENTRGPYPRFDMRHLGSQVRKSGGELGSLAAVAASHQQEYEHMACFATEDKCVKYEVLFDADEEQVGPAPVVAVDEDAVVEQFKRLLERPTVASSYNANSALDFGASTGGLVDVPSVAYTPKDRVCKREGLIPGIDFLPGLDHFVQPVVRSAWISITSQTQNKMTPAPMQPVLPGEDFPLDATNTSTVDEPSCDLFQTMDDLSSTFFDCEDAPITDLANQHAVDLSEWCADERWNNQDDDSIFAPISRYSVESQRFVPYTTMVQVLGLRNLPRHQPQVVNVLLESIDTVESPSSPTMTSMNIADSCSFLPLGSCPCPACKA